MIRIGTSGYSYTDWKGPFYPDTISSRDMLSFYAERFDTTELNFSFYRVPTAKTLDAMVRRTPDNFTFTLKLHQSMTHEHSLESLDAYTESLRPIVESGKLGALLAQFAYSFHNNERNRSWLAKLREAFADYPLVVEFRNNEWIRKPVFPFLQSHSLAFCCVDEPKIEGLLKPEARFTTDPAYLRFHSRDEKKWYGGDAKERYNYLYSENELAEWVPGMKDLATKSDTVFVFFNNCHAGQAALNASQFQRILMEEGLVE